MQPPLINASNKNLADVSANLPDVSQGILGFLYPMVFELVQTTLIDGYAQNVSIKTYTQGSIQPFTAQLLKLKPEGDRNWSWFTIHALENLVLRNGDKIKVDGVRYKIMEKLNWIRNGYIEYHAILDYKDVD